MDEMQRSLLPTPSAVVAEKCYQEISREISFEHGLLLQFLPSTIILHVALTMPEQQVGLLEVMHSTNGRRMVPYCGSVAIVCFPDLVGPSRLLMASLFSRVGQKYPLVRVIAIIRSSEIY
jgi:hypothetical protein